jgi:hypothetical protein
MQLQEAYAVEITKVVEYADKKEDPPNFKMIHSGKE